MYVPLMPTCYLSNLLILASDKPQSRALIVWPLHKASRQPKLGDMAQGGCGLSTHLMLLMSCETLSLITTWL